MDLKMDEINESEISELLQTFGIDSNSNIKSLPSYEDKNFLIKTPSGLTFVS